MLQALLPFGNSLVFWWAALTNVSDPCKCSDEGLTKRCSEPRSALVRSFFCMRTSVIIPAVADLVSR
jgi:hypothetical protein